MNDNMYGYCAVSSDHLHKRHAIGYEKLAEGPTYENRGTSLAVTRAAYFRYWVIWVCDACARTWWVEDHPDVEAASS